MESAKQTFSPFVYWAQTENQITLKVDLKDVKDPDVEICENSLTFSTRGLGARGLSDYKFIIQFYSKVNVNVSTYKVSDVNVDFTIKKCENGWWPRLTAQPQKPHWLKVDFNRWRSEDDVEEETSRDVMQDYPGMFEKLEKEEYGYTRETWKKVYLIFYNFAQFIGFLYIFLVLSILYYRDGVDSIPHAFESVGNAVKFCQLLQYLEVMHPMFGYTKGSVLIPFLQVTGRCFVLFAMVDQEPRMHTKPVILYLFFVWSLIEIVRYPYYIMNILTKEVHFLTWLRYTLWIPLYPLGILCEGIIILRNIPYFEETKRLSLDMPNKWNLTFDMTTFMKIYLLVLILPGTYFLMTHMSKTRAKKLGGRKLRFD